MKYLGRPMSSLSKKKKKQIYKFTFLFYIGVHKKIKNKKRKEGEFEMWNNYMNDGIRKMLIRRVNFMMHMDITICFFNTSKASS